MSRLTVAGICPRMALADPRTNLRRLEDWAQRAARAGAGLALFPEVYITGYMGDAMDGWPEPRHRAFMALAETVPGPTTDRLAEVARRLEIAICAGLLERDGATHYNAQVMVVPDGGCVGHYRKVQVGRREEWFSVPGDQFPVFDVSGIPTGIMICRDKSYPEIARILALEGAELLLNPHSTTESPQTPFTDWSLRLCIARAMENGCYLVANNSIFDHPIPADRQAGQAFAIDPWGRVVAVTDGPADRESMIVFDVDRDVIRERRDFEGEHFNLNSRIPSAYGRLIRPDEEE